MPPTSADATQLRNCSSHSPPSYSTPCGQPPSDFSQSISQSVSQSVGAFSSQYGQLFEEATQQQNVN